MAAAQILNLTHAVDNKVTGVGNKLKDMDAKMDAKMDAVITGRPGCWLLIHPILIECMLARWKGHKVGSSANFEQRRWRQMFVSNPLATAPRFLTCSQ